METGTIAKWHLTAGDTFGAGDVLCEIETDKATMDFEAQDDGRIAKILKDGADATDLNVGVPICVVVEEDDDIAAFADYVAEGAATEETNEEVDPPAATPSASAPAAAPAQEITVSMEHILMPSARHLSQSKGVDATGLPGTGKGGRITKGDVLEAFKNGVDLPPLSVASTTVADVAAPAAATSAAIPTPAAASISNAPVTIPTIHPSGTFTDTPNNNMRKVIAKRLTESKSTVPHFYASAEIELDNIMSLRKKLKEDMDVSIRQRPHHPRERPRTPGRSRGQRELSTKDREGDDESHRGY